MLYGLKSKLNFILPPKPAPKTNPRGSSLIYSGLKRYFKYCKEMQAIINSFGERFTDQKITVTTYLKCDH